MLVPRARPWARLARALFVVAAVAHWLAACAYAFGGRMPLGLAHLACSVACALLAGQFHEWISRG